MYPDSPRTTEPAVPTNNNDPPGIAALLSSTKMPLLTVVPPE